MNERLQQWFRDQAAEVLEMDYAHDPDAPAIELDGPIAEVRPREDGTGAWVSLRMFILAPFEGEPVDGDGVPR